MKKIVSLVLIAVLVMGMVCLSSTAYAQGIADKYTVLVLDTSGGVDFQDGKGGILYSAKTSVDYVKQASKKFVSDMMFSSNNYVSLVTYDSTAKIISEFSTDSSAIQNQINQLTAGQKNGANIAEALEQANSLLDSIPNENAIKNVVLFSTGFTQVGTYSYDGFYSASTVGGSWKNSGTNIPLYAYANSANAVAEKIKTKAGLYSVGMFQNLNNITGLGKEALALFKLTALDIATSPDYFYDINDPSNLEFAFGEIAENILDASNINLKHEQLSVEIDINTNSSFYIYRITANIVNENDKPINNVIATITLDNGMQLSNGGSIEKNIGILKAFENITETWDIKIPRDNNDLTLTYKVIVTSIDTVNISAIDKIYVKGYSINSKELDFTKDVWSFENYEIGRAHV